MSKSIGLHTVEGGIVVGDALSERVQTTGIKNNGYESEGTVDAFAMNPVLNDTTSASFPFQFVHVSKRNIS